MKVQKTKYGYTFSMIKKRMRMVKAVDGNYINIVHLGSGPIWITYMVKFLTAELIELNNCFGTAPVYISK